MKPVKMLGLALVAALASMAFVGAASAPAESTALCNTETSPCGSVFAGHVEETSSKVVIKMVR